MNILIISKNHKLILKGGGGCCFKVNTKPSNMVFQCSNVLPLVQSSFFMSSFPSVVGEKLYLQGTETIVTSKCFL